MEQETPPEVIPAGMQFIPAGIYQKEHEDPSRTELVEVKGFLLDQHPVTVAEFRRFTAVTGYVTDAENFGDAAVFSLEQQQWVLVKGAHWEYPLGMKEPKATDDHPVTQVSWNDAIAYCQWAGKRLPTEKEWEYAARSNDKNNTEYSWGNNLQEHGEYQANVWQGEFPALNTAVDGFLYTAPVGRFGKTGNGLSDMGGKVWQWTADDAETTIEASSSEKSLKGGSFMCDMTFCHNYRIDGKTSSSRETALFHTGFRCTKSL